MPKAFRITNHNRYENKLTFPSGEEVHGYDEYSLLYVQYPEFSPDRNLMGHKMHVIQRLKQEICADIDAYIKINPASIISNGFTFGLFVYEPERSALIKLTYS